MKSPKDMGIIEIDITNACVNKCSNCTRHCGHHKKPFFMDFETFKNAVNSLDDWDGCVGLIGGEPTLHPEFEKFADYIGKRRLQKPLTYSREPISDMVKHMNTYLRDFGNSKTVLWSSLNNAYYRHFEIINECFQAQGLNDHNNTCMHQGLLMARKDLGIDDKEWIEKRDACWLQNTWSASITPKGAFFCEVAGTLDTLFNGPGGWDVTKDWWKREPKDFGDQLHWCELCSACLDVPKRISNDGRDDITPTLLEKLKEVESPKIKRGEYVLWDLSNYDKTKYKTFVEADEYMSASGGVRTSSANRHIYPRSFTITQDKEFTNETLPKDWVIASDNLNEADELATNLKHFIINPGCLYKFNDSLIFNKLARSIRDVEKFSKSDLEKLYPQDKIIVLKELPSAFDIYDEEYLQKKIKTETFKKYLDCVLEEHKNDKIFIINEVKDYSIDIPNLTSNAKDADIILTFVKNFGKALNYLEKEFSITQKDKKIYNMFEDNIQQEYHYYKLLNEGHFKEKLNDLKDKKCVIYGAGTLFNIIDSYFSLDNIDIQGISDKKFECSDFVSVSGFKAIRPDKLKNLSLDKILLTTVGLKDKKDKLKKDLGLSGNVDIEFCYD